MSLTDPIIGAFADVTRRVGMANTALAMTAQEWKHYWAWHVIGLAHLRAAQEDRIPAYPVWFVPLEGDIDACVTAQNTAIDALHPAWNVADAYAAWNTVVTECIAVAGTLPAHIRADHTAFAWLNGACVDDVIRAQIHHYSDHMPKTAAECAFDDALYALRQEYQWWSTHAHHPHATVWEYTHLWAWQTISIARIRAGLAGTTPQYPEWPTDNPDNHAALDINAWIEQTHGGVTREAAIARWDAGFNLFVGLLVQIPAEWYGDPARSPWLDGYVLLDVIKGSTAHHAEHRNKE